jgi:hypothetical protein
MTRLIKTLLLMALVAAACTSNTESTTTSTTSAPQPTLPPGITVAITEVAFGAEGSLTLTNHGSQPVNLRGGWLGQGLSFLQFAEVIVDPGGSVIVGVGEPTNLDNGVETGAYVGIGSALGTLDAAAGEVALFRHGDFEDSEAVISYVQWGTLDGRHAKVAGAANLWDPESFVATAFDALRIISSESDPRSVDAWSVD